MPTNANKDLLHRCGLKATRTRLLVLATLEEQGRAVTPEALFRQLLTTNECALATIYRTLNELRQSGLLTRQRFARKVVFSLRQPSGDVAAVCDCCGTSFLFVVAEEVASIRAKVGVHGFRADQD